MSSIEERLRSASADVHKATGQSVPPTDQDMRRRQRHRAALLAGTCAVLLIVPLAVLAFSRSDDPTVSTAADTPPETATPRPALSWSTPTVEFQANAIQVSNGDVAYQPRQETAIVRSDPGEQKRYTTLEVVWGEGGGTMMLNLYFTSDGVDWWANEIRVYGAPNSGWVTFTGEYLRAPLGQHFLGDLELAGSSTKGPVTLRFDGLDVQAFPPPAGCRTDPGAVSIEILYPSIQMSSAANSGFGVAVRLLDDTCEEVANYDDYRFDWTVTDPTLVTVAPGHSSCAQTQPCRPQRADLTASRPGETDLTVTVTSATDAEPLATATMTIHSS